MCGRPGPPFSRAISSRCAATVRRSSATSSSSCNTKLLSSAAQRPSMSGRDIPRLSQKPTDSGIASDHTESFRRTPNSKAKLPRARTFAPLTQSQAKSLIPHGDCSFVVNRLPVFLENLPVSAEKTGDDLLQERRSAGGARYLRRGQSNQRRVNYSQIGCFAEPYRSVRTR